MIDCLEACRQNDRGFDVIEDFIKSPSAHLPSYKEAEAVFAAGYLRRHGVRSVVNVGSYRLFVLGLTASIDVVTIDVREHALTNRAEVAMQVDARSIPMPSGSVEAIVTLSSIEHFGLGRYGDEFDLDGDLHAMKELGRFLAPGGLLVLTTTITRAQRTIAFNAHRIYDAAALRELAGEDFAVEHEAFFSRTLGRFCDPRGVTDERGTWDVYCGAWRRR